MELVAQIFNMKVSKFLRQIIKFIFPISPIMYQRLVENVERKFKMEKISSEKKSFRKFPYARYAKYFTFEKTFRRVGCFHEGTLYFSGMHKLYGHKVEVILLSIGSKINSTNHHPGYVSDLEILQRKKRFSQKCH